LNYLVHHAEGGTPGCQMVYFQTKNPNLGHILEGLAMVMLVYFMSIWSIFRPFVIFDDTLVDFVVIWYIFSVLVNFTAKNLATLAAALQQKNGK
jgi:hypothetical protein